MKIEIFLANPRGYCAWVVRAVSMLDKAITQYWTPLYVNHEIIHNNFIIQSFTKKWVIFWENINNIPKNSIIMFSAHWIWPDFIHKVKKQQLRYIDASCPLVTKVHNEAKKFIQEWYNILYIGKKWHQEAVWILEEWKDKIHVIEKYEDINTLLFLKQNSKIKLALLTQTTLSVADTKNIIQKIQKTFPHIILPQVWDICYATTNRQNAVKELCKNINILYIVWSKNSSNSIKLLELWKNEWIQSFLIDTYNDINMDILINAWNQFSPLKIWVSGWASAPEESIKWVINFLKTIWESTIIPLNTIKENMSFNSTLILQH